MGPAGRLPCLPMSLPVSDPKFTKDCRFCFLFWLRLLLSELPTVPRAASSAPTELPLGDAGENALGRRGSWPDTEEKGPLDRVADEKPTGMTEPTCGVFWPPPWDLAFLWGSVRGLLGTG